MKFLHKKWQKWTGVQFSSRVETIFLECSSLSLRVFSSSLIMIHGYGKLANYTNLSTVFPDPIGLGSECTLILAIFTEFILGIALLLGLFTRLAALGIFSTMCVAALIVHQADPFMKKELAILYALVFLSLMLQGGRRWSLDYYIKKIC